MFPIIKTVIYIRRLTSWIHRCRPLYAELTRGGIPFDKRRNLTARKARPIMEYLGELCLSPNYFGDLIKKETGKTALEWIQNKIISTAKERLLLSSGSISQIACNLGFQYPQHFTRVFKRMTGMIPNEYREKADA
ncbi:helix-turn-helix domain-containing protein [uncultured Bacteroides sp.]|uniref:helix-turn-helix domain-containing protein n=1 Tax=uncultured Bacteroides sp. TaxID=162156 RepID=UPI00261700CB|nr:helix-turn-helix domain-containing protein [uncultured Bacteroides sp.]